ncbi:Uncharacterised protein [Brevundimonas vesicularis]|uniref:Uncharacterized protein n=1 Tax=Brevundimonas vesicularis TaxID=41276 RepID=A0A2X1BHF5_BREVE|nr:hypothetical protein [Brevundimonas vesicularis]SPU55890.1 Uncharacterised protein [Brevundimonas vesicularis]
MTKLKATRQKMAPASPGDLVVLQIQGTVGWTVLSVAEVDEDGAITAVFDVDGRAIAIYRMTDSLSSWFVCGSERLREGAHAELQGLTSPDIAAIKAAFRECAADV